MTHRHLIAALLGATLGLSVLVVYLAAALFQRPAPPMPHRIIRTVTNTVVRTAVSHAAPEAAPPPPFKWSTLESEDYATFIANLRAVECPEETIRDLVIVDIEKLYAKRRAALLTPTAEFQYWKTGDSPANVAADKARLRQVRALDDEKRALIKELLGVDENQELQKWWGNEDLSTEQRLSFLPEEKQNAVRAWQTHFAEQENAIYQAADGYPTAEDTERVRRLHAEHRAELAKLLTPAELEQHDLRVSDTANEMRASLAGFDPSPEEFKSLFKLRQTFATTFDENLPPDDPAAAAKRDEAQRLLDAEAKKLLGEKRFAEYQQAQDGEYQNLRRLAEHFELPPEAARGVYQMKQLVEQQTQLIREDETLSDEDRQQALQRVRDQTQAAIRKTLGEKAAAAYQSQGGYWLQGATGLPYLNLSDPPPGPPLIIGTGR